METDKFAQDVAERVEDLRERYDDTYLLNTSKHLGGMLIGLSVASVSFSMALFYVDQGASIKIFIAALLAWAGYLFAHYSITGVFIDQPLQQRVIPHSIQRVIGGIFGFLLLAAGFTILTLGFGNGDFITTQLGMATAILGYLIAHYELTGIPL